MKRGAFDDEGEDPSIPPADGMIRGTLLPGTPKWIHSVHPEDGSRVEIILSYYGGHIGLMAQGLDFQILNKIIVALILL